jgi:hypothetical protein
VQPLGRRRAGIYVQQHGAGRRVLLKGGPMDSFCCCTGD